MTAEQGVAGLEKSLEELEALLKELESGELSLEAALERFERGVKLTRQCQQALRTAEQKGGDPVTQDAGWRTRTLRQPRRLTPVRISHQ